MSDEDIENVEIDDDEQSIEINDDKKKRFDFSKLIKKSSKDDEDGVEIEVAETHSAIEEIREFKLLLDEGIITQEEFDAKKKEVLNL